MGNKGSATTSTNQTQSYNPAGGQYIQNALQQGQQAAGTPFNLPVAPVAGFSNDQLQAFQGVRNAQGMAQPYFNQAQNYFGQSAQAPNISQFFNPYAGAVTDQLKNIFGQQMSQATGQLTQQAGGVGADRIAVGQSQLANQQGLAAGQTLAGLYAPSLQAAQQEQNIQQGAGYGTAALGSAAQNAAFSGAQQLLGTGGLQQQLSQAQLNAPYQWQVAQQAYPFQTAQFNAGITGALAPGLGGTTSGYGQQRQPGPSWLSQILGGAGLGVGLYGAFGGFGGGEPNAEAQTGGGSSTNPLPGLSAADYGQGFAEGGVAPIRPEDRDRDAATAERQKDNLRALWERGGVTSPLPDNVYRIQGGRAEGGEVEGSPFALPAGFNDKPINIAPQSMVPQEKLTPIQAQQPHLNLNPPAQGGGGGGDDVGKMIQTGMKLATMFLHRGGAVNPYADGGDVASFDDRWNARDEAINWDSVKRGLYNGAKSQGAFADYLLRGGAGRPPSPYAGGPDYDLQVAMEKRGRGYADGGDAPNDYVDKNFPYAGEINSGSEVMGDPRAAQRLFRSAIPTSPASRDAMAFAGEPSDDDFPAVLPKPRPAAADASPYAAPAAPPPEASQLDARPSRDTNGFARSPWLALASAGLGMMASRSPFAGVAIGEGGLQGIKTLEEQRAAGQKDESIDQAARRLGLEAKHHEDQYTRMTPYQQATLDRQKSQDDLALQRFNRPYNELTKGEQATLEESKRQHDLARIPQGFKQGDDGSLAPTSGGPHDPKTIAAEAAARRPPGMADEALTPLVDSYIAGNTGVLTGIGRGTQGAQNLERFWTLTAQKLKDQGLDGKNLAAARANFMAQSAGARVAAQRESNIETAVNEANGTFPQVLKTSEALPRTNYPAVNQAIQLWRTQTGAPEQRAFGAAMQAAITAYSQAMSRTGTNSVYAQQHAEEIMSKVDGHPALQAAIKQLQTEMAIAKAAPEETRQNILNRILGIKESAANTSPAAGTKPQTVTQNGYTYTLQADGTYK